MEIQSVPLNDSDTEMAELPPHTTPAAPPTASSADLKATMPTTTQSLLLTLPAELRNWIWELVFAHASDKLVNLFAATPPTKNVLLCCREIHAEAKGLHKAAYRHYWQATNFLVKRGGSTNGVAALKQLDNEDLAQTRHLTFRTSFTQLQVSKSTHYSVMHFFSLLALQDSNLRPTSSVQFTRCANGSWAAQARLLRSMDSVYVNDSGNDDDSSDENVTHCLWAHTETAHRWLQAFSAGALVALPSFPWVKVMKKELGVLMDVYVE